MAVKPLIGIFPYYFSMERPFFSNVDLDASAAIRSGGETPAVGSSSYGGEHGCSR